MIPTEVDNGSDGTASISKKIIEFKNRKAEVIESWEITTDSPIDLRNYIWEKDFIFTVELYLTDGSYYEKDIVVSNNKILFNSNTAISSESKLAYFVGGATAVINKTIEIPANIIMVNIVGLSYTSYRKLSFNIAERGTPLLINIKNLTMDSYYDETFATSCFYADDMAATFTVMRFEGNNYFHASSAYMNSAAFEFYRNTLYMIGDSTATLTIQGADGEAAEEGKYGRSGSSGIAAEALTIQGFSAIYIYGGNGSQGGKGENGKDAPNYTYIGYNGYLGEDGGNGANAIYCDYLTINVTSLYAYGGDGGQGGQGGDGGNGAHGKDGAGGAGSKGRIGGNGGNGGNGGDAIYVHRSASINVSNTQLLIGGAAGKAGKGGTGGNGGDGGKGATGSSGIIAGKGGTGGNGGDGGDGGDGGSVGSAGYGLNVSDQRSGTIGNLYNSTYYLNQAKGNGGTGGQGGQGGNGGDGWFGKKGAAGAKGNPGTSGSAGRPGHVS